MSWLPATDPASAAPPDSVELVLLPRAHDVGGWHRFAMSTSEFLYRILADADFQPFGIAQYDLDTTFKPGSADDE